MTLEVTERQSCTLKAVPAKIEWHRGLSIYASEPFLKSTGDEYGWLAGVDEAGRRRCILPYTIVRKTTVRLVRFRVETIPLVDDLGIEEEKSFLNSAVEYFRSIGADTIIPGTTNAIFRTYPDGAVAAPYGTFLIDLTQPEETLWNNLHSKHRNVIRNAVKKGVRVIDGLEHVDTAYNLVEETFKRSSMPFMSRESFARMVTALGEQVKVFIAEYQGAIQGAAVIPFSDFRAYYVYGGTNAEPLTGASNMLQWEAIKFFRGLGVKSYDFCGVRINPEKGSKQAGLMMFKERFGPKLVQGYMWKQSLAPLKSAIYSLGVRWLRGGDIVDREHHKLGAAEMPMDAELNEAAE
jgi:hypothetical protein